MAPNDGSARLPARLQRGRSWLVRMTVISEMLGERPRAPFGAGSSFSGETGAIAHVAA